MASSNNIGIGSDAYRVENGDITNNSYNNIALGNIIYYLSDSNPSTFSGRYNIGIGNEVYRLSSGSMAGYNNIGIGYETYTVTKGDITNTAASNIALGYRIYQLNGSNTSTFSGFQNIGIGSEVLSVRSGDLTGAFNIGLGHDVLYGGHNLTGNSNIGIGRSSLLVSGSNATIAGSDNIALGQDALANYSGGLLGNNNIAIGHSALYTFNSTDNAGNNNIAIGQNALYSNSTGVVRGSYNIAIGFFPWGSGSNLVYGNANIQIGNHTVGTPVAGQLNNVVAIGNQMNGLSTSTTDSNTILLGIQGSLPNSPKVGVGIYKPQAKLHVLGDIKATANIETLGSVKVGDGGNACTPANEGTIRFQSGHFYGCDGATWKQLDN